MLFYYSFEETLRADGLKTDLKNIVKYHTRETQQLFVSTVEGIDRVAKKSILELCRPT
jgi:hypothetical protein